MCVVEHSNQAILISVGFAKRQVVWYCSDRKSHSLSWTDPDCCLQSASHSIKCHQMAHSSDHVSSEPGVGRRIPAAGCHSFLQQTGCQPRLFYTVCPAIQPTAERSYGFIPFLRACVRVKAAGPTEIRTRFS